MDDVDEYVSVSDNECASCDTLADAVEEWDEALTVLTEPLAA